MGKVSKGVPGKGTIWMRPRFLAAESAMDSAPGGSFGRRMESLSRGHRRDYRHAAVGGDCCTQITPERITLIHAVEASLILELAGIDNWAPISWSACASRRGNLVHMPAHIYIRVGDYHDAARTVTNKPPKSIAAHPEIQCDRNVSSDVLQPQPPLPCDCRRHEGRFRRLNKGRRLLIEHYCGAAGETGSHGGGFSPTEILILVKFHHWEECAEISRAG